MISYDLLATFAEFTVAAAGIALGLCTVIVVAYWRVFRSVSNGARLLPAHVMLIGTSYAMFALVAVSRLGDPPPPAPGRGWWVYPFITLAFVMGDVALVIILRFVSRRGPRYRPQQERRA